MQFNLIIVKQSPYQGRTSHEILEAIMSLALFDIDHKVVFFENGISWLFNNQTPDQTKSLEKQIAALPMYGSENLYYCSEHQAELFPGQSINDRIDAISVQKLTEWCHLANHVEVF